MRNEERELLDDFLTCIPESERPEIAYLYALERERAEKSPEFDGEAFAEQWMDEHTYLLPEEFYGSIDGAYYAIKFNGDDWDVSRCHEDGTCEHTTVAVCYMAAFDSAYYVFERMHWLGHDWEEDWA